MAEKMDVVTDRVLHRLGWLAFAISAVLLAGSVVLGWATRDVAHSDGFGGGGGTGFAAAIVVNLIFLLYPAAGIVVVRRRPRNPIGWLLIVTGCAWGMVEASIAYGDWALKVHAGNIPGGAVVASVSLWAWAPAVAITGAFLLLVFPNGHLPGPRWRWLSYLCGLAVAVSIVVDVLTPGPMTVTGFPGHHNPFGVRALAPVASALEPVVILIPLSTVGAIVSLVARYRRAGLTERLQIKWLAAAGAFCGTLYGAALILAAVYSSSNQATPDWVNTIQDVWFVSLGLIPVAIGFAVMRYKLFEIDVIIRRTLIYTLVVGGLALVYLGGAAVIGSLLRGLTGSSGTVAVSVSTLAAVAAFQPLRRATQRMVDRRFYRAGYDAQATLDRFGERLREQIDLDALCEELRGVVAGTVQPAHTSIWLLEPTPETSARDATPAVII
jgi:hypothetical protein